MTGLLSALAIGLMVIVLIIAAGSLVIVIAIIPLTRFFENRRDRNDS